MIYVRLTAYLAPSTWQLLSLGAFNSHMSLPTPETWQKYSLQPLSATCNLVIGLTFQRCQKILFSSLQSKGDTWH